MISRLLDTLVWNSGGPLKPWALPISDRQECWIQTRSKHSPRDSHCLEVRKKEKENKKEQQGKEKDVIKKKYSQPL